MATNFSEDRAPAPARFSPAAGNQGAKAAERAARPARASGRHGGAQARGLGGQRESGQHPDLGHPDFNQVGDQDQDEQPDNRHIGLVNGWFNMQGLGRMVPYTVWSGLTGNYRQFSQPGKLPFDIFEDT